ncbi:cytochrome c oxidase assembly factor 1 homolog [Tachyglossus aculeatus]|uniref:cytochrome c oxidase assembly factor 1 homolog n=1 Tax=Tachyglossus aculeatus TaxID=9261 RepID=UPI0018F76432|nr:cytochrome c oxidase assembly factor 1 homolog [Tachyglossus aculeatus]
MPAVLRKLRHLALYMTLLSGGGCTLMYYLMQKNFAKSEFYQLALEELKRQPAVLEALGAPPLKVHHISLTDRHNRIDVSGAQMKVPVSGSKTAGELYIHALRDVPGKRWNLQEVILHLKDGQRVPVYQAGVEKEAGGKSL